MIRINVQNQRKRLPVSPRFLTTAFLTLIIVACTLLFFTDIISEYYNNNNISSSDDNQFISRDEGHIAQINNEININDEKTKKIIMNNRNIPSSGGGNSSGKRSINNNNNNNLAKQYNHNNDNDGFLYDSKTLAFLRANIQRPRKSASSIKLTDPKRSDYSQHGQMKKVIPDALNHKRNGVFLEVRMYAFNLKSIIFLLYVYFI